MSKISQELRQIASRLIASTNEAALGTLDADGTPFASYVTIAPDEDGRPLLLLSDLARHTANLTRSPACSLLCVADVEGAGDPLMRGRITLVGRLARASDQKAARSRYCSVHPYAAGYAEFSDFAVYRMTVTGGHLVAGFGRIAELSPDDLFPAGS